MLIDGWKNYSGTNQSPDSAEHAGSIHSKFSLVKKYSTITTKTLSQGLEKAREYSMNNILYDIYKRYSANAWLSPFERALVRLLKMLVITFIVGALPALGSAVQSINSNGSLDSFSWNGVIQAVLFGGTVSVLATMWKYGNAKEEAGSTYPASEAGKSIEQQVIDTLEHALPNLLANLSATPTTPPVEPVQDKVPLVIKTGPAPSGYEATPVPVSSIKNMVLDATQYTPTATPVPVLTPSIVPLDQHPLVSVDGASDAATPNKTAGAGYDGGMGQPLPDEVDANDTWLLDTVQHPSLPAVAAVIQPDTSSATADASISA